MENELIKKGELFQIITDEFEYYPIDNKCYRVVKDFYLLDTYDEFVNQLPRLNDDAIKFEIRCIENVYDWFCKNGYLKCIGGVHTFLINNNVKAIIKDNEMVGYTDRYIEKGN